MKKITFIYSFLLCMTALTLASCNDDDGQMTDTKITYYMAFEIQGDEFVQVPIGTPYIDQGCKATINGQDCTSRIKTTGVETINVNKAGLYYITYSGVNDDGYGTSVTRTVAVCDPAITTDISGAYKTAEGTYRLREGATTAYPGWGVTIRRDAPGIFYVSDILGGYYSLRAAYGDSYAMKGYIQLLADNSLEIISGDVAGWGDSFTDFKDGKYDPATKQLSWCVTYAGMDFYVVLAL